MNLLNILLMAPPAGDGKSGGSIWQTVIMFALIAVVFYLFFIRPQSKRNKEMKKFRESLKKGDKILTAGGIHGKIIEMQETTAIIETEGQGRLKIEKSSIAQYTSSDQAAETK
jgi:preprotein translocase subunit YajC